jgi:C4-dicarboxylate-specific signal transduction histidine kinase
VAIPLVLNEQLLGVINLGKKSNLKRYNAVDFQFLTTLKNQSAIALSNSLIYQNIEEQVKERTQELVEVQKQLIQAEKLATVGTLSGGVAHEINNPLSAILMNVQMLLAVSDDDGVKVDKESLELIEEATQRCRTIVQKLMVYAKKPLETDEISVTDLCVVLKKTLAFIGYQLEQDNIKIIMNIKEEPLTVMGNPNELEQVFTNIILNARDAVKEAKRDGKIYISLFKDRNDVKVEIKDEGIGIPQECISKIFDPFFTTKEIGKGLGLGLSICQSIVEKYKGRISVQSEFRNGTIFTIVFPGHFIKEEKG